MWPRRKRQSEPVGEDEARLVEECEAFLGGRYAERLCRSGAHVPAWAWTNLLAHATESELEEQIRLSEYQMALPSDWRRARCYLAGEVLRVARSNGPLARLQADRLVPLEQQLSTLPTARCLTPGEWVTRVLVQLGLYEHAERARLDRD
jgi:hypothetical protein